MANYKEYFHIALNNVSGESLDKVYKALFKDAKLNLYIIGTTDLKTIVDTSKCPEYIKSYYIDYVIKELMKGAGSRGYWNNGWTSQHVAAIKEHINEVSTSQLSKIVKSLNKITNPSSKQVGYLRYFNNKLS